jgi:putative Mg2+ transporter-C (MgtC) family protein
MSLSLGEIVIRLVVAAALGAAIGLEREPAGRGVGLRTHSIVALGAAVFTLAGAYGFADARPSGDVDPARVAAQVAAGVGFIGAGAILRHGSSVQGVTTAATVWLAAGVGVMASAGGELVATVATVIAMVSLLLLRSTKPLVRRLGCRNTVVEMTYARGHGTLGPVLRLLGEKGAMVQRIDVEDDDLDVDRPGIRSVRIVVSTGRRETVEDLLRVASDRPELRSIAVDGRRQSSTAGPTLEPDSPA